MRKYWTDSITDLKKLLQFYKNCLFAHSDGHGSKPPNIKKNNKMLNFVQNPVYNQDLLLN